MCVFAQDKWPKQWMHCVQSLLEFWQCNYIRKTPCSGWTHLLVSVHSKFFSDRKWNDCEYNKVIVKVVSKKPRAQLKKKKLGELYWQTQKVDF